MSRSVQPRDRGDLNVSTPRSVSFRVPRVIFADKNNSRRFERDTAVLIILCHISILISLLVHKLTESKYRD